MMKGRPVLGVFSGFLFGLFGGLTLFMYGAVPLHSPIMWILPIAGIVLGLVLAAWAPFGKSSSTTRSDGAAATYAASGAATMNEVTMEDVSASEQPGTEDAADDDGATPGTIEQ